MLSMLYLVNHHREWPPVSLCKQGPGHLSLCPSHATTTAALTNKNTTTTTTTTEGKSAAAAVAAAAAAAGLSLMASHHQSSYCTYRDTRSRPQTSSHMSGVDPIRMMMVAVLSSLSFPLSHQSLLLPPRLLT